MPRVSRIRNAVELAIRRKVAGQLHGVHSSLHIGPSQEFNDLRDYVPGDDVTDIDWKATARSGTLLVKQYVAERHGTLMVAVASGRDLAGLATPTASKASIALDAAATLGVLAASFGDHVGLVWCEEGATRTSRPSSRLVELERNLTQVESTVTPTATETDLDQLLTTTAQTLRKRGIVAVLADDVTVTAQLEARIRRLAAQHQVMWCTIPDVDPSDPELRGKHLLDIEKRLPLPDWLDDEQLGEEWRDDARRRATGRVTALSRLGVHHAELAHPERVVTDILTLVRRQRRAR
jgi:uncharacterized protein (DUF58 family)